jgi:hypothetical protein
MNETAEQARPVKNHAERHVNRFEGAPHIPKGKRNTEYIEL